FKLISSTTNQLSSLRVPQKISLNRQNNQNIKTSEIVVSSSVEQQKYLKNNFINNNSNINEINKLKESKIALTSNNLIKYKNNKNYLLTTNQQNCKKFI
ncbi:hypothetical protein Mgra_00005334, partial [Meloidogyne graminicola]